MSPAEIKVDSKTLDPIVIVLPGLLPPTAGLFCTVTDIVGEPLAGVNVAVDTVISGSTDSQGICSLYGIEFGSYIVNFSKYGYETLERPVELTEKKTYRLDITLIPEVPIGKAILAIDTIPVKGEIYLDGISQGIAPVTLTLDPGTYIIGFGNIEGYITPEDITVTLIEGQSIIKTAEYKTVGPPEVFGLPWWAIGAGAIGIGIIIVTRKP